MTLADLLIYGPLVRHPGWVLVHFLWQGALVAGLLAFGLAALRHRTANARYLAACMAMVVLAAAPVVTYFLLPPASAEQQAAAISAARPVAGNAPDGPTEAPLPPHRAVRSSGTGRDEAAATVRPHDPAHGGASGGDYSVQDSSDTARPSSGIVDKGTSETPRQADFDWSKAVLPWCVIVWVTGVVLLSAWQVIVWIYVQRMHTTAWALSDPPLQATVGRLTSRLALRRPVQVLVSLRVAGPIVIGWLKPVVLLPMAALTGLSTTQLEAILAHELAHVRRYDYLVNLLQIIVETLLFYHPAVWWVSRRMRIEREHCCDDVAVAAYGDRTGYAGALAMLAENAAVSRAAVAAGGGHLLARIRRLLVPGAGHADGGNTYTAGAILLAGLLVLVVCWAMMGASGGTLEAPRDPPATPARETGPGFPAMSEHARSRAARLEHQFEMTLEYHGPAKSSYVNLRLYDGPSTSGTPLPAPWLPLRPGRKQVAAILRFLAEDGFLDAAEDIRGGTTGPVTRLSEPPDGPCYVMVIPCGEEVLYHNLGWDREMFERLDRLRRVLKGDPAEAMDELLDRLEIHRKDRHACAAGQPAPKVDRRRPAVHEEGPTAYRTVFMFTGGADAHAKSGPRAPDG